MNYMIVCYVFYIYFFVFYSGSETPDIFQKITNGIGKHLCPEIIERIKLKFRNKCLPMKKRLTRYHMRVTAAPPSGENVNPMGEIF